MYILYSDQINNNISVNSTNAKSQSDLTNKITDLNKLQQEYLDYQKIQGSALNAEKANNGSLAWQNYNLQKDFEVTSAKYNIATQALNQQSQMPLNIYQGIASQLNVLDNDIKNKFNTQGSSINNLNKHLKAEIINNSKSLASKMNDNTNALSSQMNNNTNILGAQMSINTNSLTSQMNNNTVQLASQINNNVNRSSSSSGSPSHLAYGSPSHLAYGSPSHLAYGSPSHSAYGSPHASANAIMGNASLYSKLIGLNISPKNDTVNNLMKILQQLITYGENDMCSLVDKNKFESYKVKYKQELMIGLEQQHLGSLDPVNNNFIVTASPDAIQTMTSAFVLKNISTMMSDPKYANVDLNKYTAPITNLLNIIISSSVNSNTGKVDLDKFIQLINDIFYSICPTANHPSPIPPPAPTHPSPIPPPAPTYPSPIPPPAPTPPAPISPPAPTPPAPISPPAPTPPAQIPPTAPTPPAPNPPTPPANSQQPGGDLLSIFNKTTGAQFNKY